MSRIVFTALLALSLIASPAHADTDWVAAATAARPSLVRVQGVWEGKTTTVCTAFSINEAKNYFLTANHCDIRQSTDSPDGDTEQGTDDHKIWVEGHEAFPIYQNPDIDVMVLVVPDAGDVPALHLTTTVAPAEAIMMYGWGFGLDYPLIRVAHVAIPDVSFPAVYDHYHYGVPNASYILFDAPFVHGQSGGPIIDPDGHVISVVQANVPDGIGISVTTNVLQNLTGKYWEK